jgi:hypothetical protein
MIPYAMPLFFLRCCGYECNLEQPLETAKRAAQSRIYDLWDSPY